MALNKNNRAPTTIFAASTLSPRQIATKAITLGCKKLDRDDRRSKPRYDVRERLLLCNTIAKAEEVLNKRTRRTNRRVMSAEEEEDAFNAESHQSPQHHSPESHSPLRSSNKEEDVPEDEKDPDTDHASQSSSASVSSSPFPESMLPRDCRRIISHDMPTTPIAAII
ncbi:hypothetical protein DFQ28_009398 [Apophysomyces sp. BC1034]|nr:hypothetical protein DFQ30_008463 [Apophysomyces sp. BC1015]KAG0174598.1 hypothetical protein DFQ29_007433 [Apophysomyces sp. BC1021]KAG0185400.1 hypothetical protein DFQ28_009398 [Apophysomyces sp. BC1034]